MKKILIAVVLFFSVVLLVGCGNKDEKRENKTSLNMGLYIDINSMDGDNSLNKITLNSDGTLTATYCSLNLDCTDHKGTYKINDKEITIMLTEYYDDNEWNKYDETETDTYDIVDNKTFENSFSKYVLK